MLLWAETEACVRRKWARMKGRKRGGEFQAASWRIEMKPDYESVCSPESEKERPTHLQRLKGHVYPSDGLGKRGVITGQVWDDAPRCGRDEAGGGHLDGGILGQPRKRYGSQPRRKGGGRRLNMKPKSGELDV